MQLSFPLTQSNGHVSVVDDDGHIDRKSVV